MEAKYVIITPAYNEASLIRTTIEAVLAQTFRPVKWVIVDDGSTDDTAAIIGEYVNRVSWLECVRREKVACQTYYASNVHAIACGMKSAAATGADYYAILDADISLPQDYYQTLILRMQHDSHLGIASGVYVDNVDGRLRAVLNDRRSTPKGLMVFRRTCYDQIGGFIPMKYGGEDTCACFMARMKGWKSWSFPDLVATHNKPVGTGHGASLVQIRFRQGRGEYYLATHPCFMLLKSLRRCAKESPLILGGLARLAGYACAHLRREERQMPQELIRYIRREQCARLWRGNSIPRDMCPNELAVAPDQVTRAEVARTIEG